jgi:hypothetical protein
MKEFKLALVLMFVGFFISFAGYLFYLSPIGFLCLLSFVVFNLWLYATIKK